MPASPAPQASLYDQLVAKTPRIPVTLALIAANLLVFCLMLGAGASLWHGGNSLQLAWGANFGPATQDGQWWRLGSALFLHFGLLHVGMNLWALWDGGRLAERMFGPLRFAAIYFACGLAGNLLSLVVQGNQAVSGGASGAIFGVYGALLVHLWQIRGRLDRQEFRWVFLAGIAFTSVSISLGFVIPGIDNSAHLGGLLTGVLAGTLLDPASPDAEGASRLARATCAALLLGTVALLIVRLPEPSYRWHEEIAARQEIQAFLARESRIQASWENIQRQPAASFAELAERIEQEIAQPYDDSFAQFSQLNLDQDAPSARQVESLRAYSEERRDRSQALASQLRARQQFGPLPPQRRAMPPPMHRLEPAQAAPGQ